MEEKSLKKNKNYSYLAGKAVKPDRLKWSQWGANVNCKNVRLWKDSLMGTPLQRREWVCRSEACSPYLGQRQAIRRQVPLSARTSLCSGHTLPWQTKVFCSALSPINSSNTSFGTEYLFSALLCAFTHRVATRRERSGARGPEKRQSWLRGTDWVGDFNVWWKRGEDQDLSATLRYFWPPTPVLCSSWMGVVKSFF